MENINKDKENPKYNMKDLEEVSKEYWNKIKKIPTLRNSVRKFFENIEKNNRWEEFLKAFLYSDSEGDLVIKILKYKTSRFGKMFFREFRNRLKNNKKILEILYSLLKKFERYKGDIDHYQSMQLIIFDTKRQLIENLCLRSEKGVVGKMLWHDRKLNNVYGFLYTLDFFIGEEVYIEDYGLFDVIEGDLNRWWNIYKSLFLNMSFDNEKDIKKVSNILKLFSRKIERLRKGVLKADIEDGADIDIRDLVGKELYNINEIINFLYGIDFGGAEGFELFVSEFIKEYIILKWLYFVIIAYIEGIDIDDIAFTASFERVEEGNLEEAGIDENDKVIAENPRFGGLESLMLYLTGEFNKMNFDKIVGKKEILIVEGKGMISDSYKVTLNDVLSKYSDIFSYLQAIEEMVLKICSLKLKGKQLDKISVKLENILKYLILKLTWFVVEGYNYPNYIGGFKYYSNMDEEDIEKVEQNIISYKIAQDNLINIFVDYYLINIVSQIFLIDGEIIELEHLDKYVSKFFEDVYNRKLELRDLKFIHFFKIAHINEAVNQFVEDFLNDVIGGEKVYSKKDILAKIMDFVFELKKHYIVEYERFDTK